MTDRNNPYDVVFSLGFCCGCSQSLRAAGLQFSSYPLDWLGVPDIVAGARQVAEEFAGWMEPEDFDLVDVNHGVGFCTRLYLNAKTRLGYSHEFSDFKRFEESFPKVKATYDRRVARLMSELRSAKRVLAVYLEYAKRDKADDATIRKAAEMLRGKFPGVQVDLAYIYENPSGAPAAVERDEDGITVISADYRVVEEGRVTQFVKIPVLAEVLRANFSAKDMRTPEEKAKYATESHMSQSLRWGPNCSAFRRWVNHHAYKTYRSLERVLKNRGLVQKELSAWFWKDMPG